MDRAVLRGLRERARASGAPPPVTSEAVTAAESALGFALPESLRRVYLDVADGGFCAAWQQELPGGTLYRLYSLKVVVSEWRAALDDDCPWPRSVLPLVFWGCSSEGAVDCRDETVLRFDSERVRKDADGNWDVSAAWTVDAADLTSWWRGWLSSQIPVELGPSWHSGME